MKKLLYLLIYFPLTLLAQPKLEWAHNYHPDQENELFPSSLEIVTDDTAFVYYAGNFVGGTDYDPTSGVDYRNNAGNGDMFLQKIKKDNGEVVWTRTWGSSGPDYLKEITLDPFGNIFVTGVYRVALDLDPGIGVDLHSAKGFDDLFLLKLDKDGNYLWGHSLKSSVVEYPGGIACDESGNVYFGAMFAADLRMDNGTEIIAEHKARFDDSFISKFSSTGELLWIHTYAIEGEYGTELKEVLIDNEGNLLVFGLGDESTDFDFGPDERIIQGDPTYIFIQKLNPNNASLIEVGTIPWRNVLDVHLDSKGNLYLTGRSAPNDTVDMDPGPGEVILDLYYGTEMVLKYNSDWEFQWVNQIRTLGGAYNSVDVDSLGNVYTTVYITNQYSLFKASNLVAFTRQRSGFPTALIMKYDVNGDLVWVQDYGKPGAYAWDICLDNEDNIYVAGDYHGSIDVDLDTSQHIFSSQPADLGQYVARYRICTPVFSTIDVFSCSGDSLEYPSGKGYIYQGGIYKDTVHTAAGCDSVITIRANFAYYITVEQITSCEPYTLPNGVVVERDTLVQIVYNSRLGCDSAARFYVDITDRLPLKKEKVTACDSLQLPNGNWVSESQIYNYEVDGPNSCPQDIELSINIKYSSSSSFSDVFCLSYTAPDASELSAPGDYQFLFTNQQGCDSVLNLTLTQESLNPNIINLTDSLAAVQENASYQWMDCVNNSNIAGATQQGFKPSVTGSYKVALSYLDCQDTSACEQITIASISELAYWGVEVYPNPFREQIVIKNNQAASLDIKLLDLSGKVILQKSSAHKTISIASAALEAGSYFLSISKENGASVNQKLIKL